MQRFHHLIEFEGFDDRFDLFHVVPIRAWLFADRFQTRTVPSCVGDGYERSLLPEDSRVGMSFADEGPVATLWCAAQWCTASDRGLPKF
jgi:hypothetical protein